MSEKTRIKKIKKGDQEALHTFIQEMYPSVYAFTYRKMQGNDVCKDITQDVFLRFIRSIPMYQEQGKCLHYLYRIASNVCKDYYRKQNVQYFEEIDDVAYRLQSDENVHESILTQIRDEELMLYIQQLSPSQQDIILLKYYHQMTFQEIADVFTISVSTIKTRHIAALKILRKQIKECDRYEG